MKKSILVLLLLITIITLISCSKRAAADAPVSTADNISNPVSQTNSIKNDQNTNPTEIQGVKEIKEINRDQAKLSTVPAKDISSFVINERIKQLLNGAQYKDQDYANGIIEDSTMFVINERFKDNIIGDIKIGSDISELRQLLGDPTVQKDNYLLYKTNSLYLGFSGEQKITAAIVAKVPEQIKDNKMICKLIAAYKDENYKDLFELLQKDEEIGRFFDHNGHIHGGGWYATAYSGIEVEEFDGFKITVFNNYEGKLYEDKELVVYDDQDFMIDRLISNLSGYFNKNRQFVEEGVLSPGGRYNSIYEWFTSDSQYFTIRSTDNSKPDFYIGAPSSEYKWLNEDYILYIDSYSSLPFTFKVEDNAETEITSIFYETGITKTNDSTEDIGSYALKIEKVEGDLIQLRDNESDKLYRFHYTISGEGQLKLTYQQ